MGAQVKAARARARRVIVVGSGAAGAAAAIRLCELGVPVTLVCLEGVGVSESALETGGIDAGSDDDEVAHHVEDTLNAAGGLAHRAPVVELARSAPRVLGMLERIGVPFERTRGGGIARHRGEGASEARTAYAGAATGSLVVRALGAQLARWSAADVTTPQGGIAAGERMLRLASHRDFVSLVLDDAGAAVGVVVQDTRTMAFEALTADAVCLATGGFGALFAESTGSAEATGAPIAAVARQGAALANPELVQLHPTTFLTAAKRRVVSERARSAGARVWTAKGADDARRAREIAERERDYLFERTSPSLANLLASRDAIGPLVASLERNHAAYVDLRHLPQAEAARVLGPSGEAYARAIGDDPRGLVRVVPAVHRCLGGLWVDFEVAPDGRLASGSVRNQATTVPGLYAAGDCEYSMHGGCGLAGNALSGAIVAGTRAAESIAIRQTALVRSAFDLPSSVFEKAQAAAEADAEALAKAHGAGDGENARQLHDELAEVMFRHAALPTAGREVDDAVGALEALRERAAKARNPDTSPTSNDEIRFLRHLTAMLDLAGAVLTGRRERAREAEPRTMLMVHEAGAFVATDRVTYRSGTATLSITRAVTTARAESEASH